MFKLSSVLDGWTPEENSSRVRWTAVVMAAIAALATAAGPFGLIANEPWFYVPKLVLLVGGALVSWKLHGSLRVVADLIVVAVALWWMFEVVRNNINDGVGFVPFGIGVVALGFLLIIPPALATLLAGGLFVTYNALLVSLDRWALEPAINAGFVVVVAVFWFRQTWNNRQLHRKNQAMVAELEEKNRHWNTLALQDSLTVLPNRRYFDQALDRLWDETAGDVRVSLLMGDIDFFKAINDQWGHAVGDSVLQGVAVTLAAQLRNPEFLARVGGEEFAVVLPGTEPNNARTVAERLRIQLEQTRLPGFPGDKPVTMSWGVATVVTGLATAAELYQAADRALYQAKANGRNRVEVSVDVTG